MTKLWVFAEQTAVAKMWLSAKWTAVTRCYLFDVRESVHYSKIHKERSNETQQYIKFYYSICIWSSTCFGRHAAHHQEPKTALAASGFSYMKGCFYVYLVDVVRHSMCLTMSANYTYKQQSMVLSVERMLSSKLVLPSEQTPSHTMDMVSTKKLPSPRKNVSCRNQKCIVWTNLLSRSEY
jgi:hypothetical protein